MVLPRAWSGRPGGTGICGVSQENPATTVAQQSQVGGWENLRRMRACRISHRRLAVAGLVLGLTACRGAPDPGGPDGMSLAGRWRFRLDPDRTGVEKRWFEQTLDDSVELPGTTDTNRKGMFRDERAVDRLSRPWYWVGPAWYQRDVEIPAAWRHKRVTLFLERTKSSRVWVDSTPVGSQDSLSAPHVFDLTGAVAPGRHTLTILVDNSKLPPVGPSHAVDERTQSNWNGIVGRLELHATDPVWIEDVQVHPEAQARRVSVRATIGNITGHPVTARLDVVCSSFNVVNPADFPRQTVEVTLTNRRSMAEFTYSPGEEAPLWDEFQPALLCLTLSLKAAGWSDRRAVSFGLRDFKREGRRLTINGRPVFLRGRVDCANYPLTGHAPMEAAEWRRILGIVRACGLNHVRFHSWCPPEAAFAAADELGMYLQVEFPNKRSAFKAPDSAEAAAWNPDHLDAPVSLENVSLYEYALRESELIFRHFGNHPSFVMYTLGNELGRTPAMAELVARFRARDPRRLYAQGSNNQHWAPEPAEGDDFWVTHKTARDRPVRGAYFIGDFGGGHIEAMPPSTRVDYRDSLAGVPLPVISHEIAEFQMTPDFRELPKYTGPLKARNLEIFRERLRDAHMLDLAHDFLRASGALAAICQRADIEAALRTPELAGFQWLDLQDFPGQGTALVGMLNVFMESKGIASPESWRQFCSETVPLVLFDRYTWTTDETFTGEVRIAHHGPADLSGARVKWALEDPGGAIAGCGVFGPLTIRQGEVPPVGEIRAPLSQVAAPRKIRLTIAIERTPFLNGYDLWVYPPAIDITPPAGVRVSRRLDESTFAHLRDGGRVVLFPQLDQLTNSVAGAFATDFWCWPMFARVAAQRNLPPPPGTQGFLCDPAHPAFAAFPTEFHSNWQWWHIVKNSRPVILDAAPPDYRPIIHVIDNFARNHRLGLLFEARVGAGRLLVCASDLPKLQDHPEARQLLHSLLQYAGSDRFRPARSLDEETLRGILGGAETP